MSRPADTRVLDVLRGDYTMLARLATDRLQALDAYATFVAESEIQARICPEPTARARAGALLDEAGRRLDERGPADLSGPRPERAAPHRAEGLRASEGPPPRLGWSILKKEPLEKDTDELAQAQRERDAAIASAMAAVACAEELRQRMAETDRAMQRLGHENEILRAEVVRRQGYRSGTGET